MTTSFDKINHLTNTLKSYIYRDSVPLSNWQIIDRLTTGDFKPEENETRWDILLPDAWWGGRMLWSWLKTDAALPEQFAGKPAALHLEFDERPTDQNSTIYSSPEAMVTVRGVATSPQALNEAHPDILLTECAEPGDIHITLHCFAGVALPGDLRVRLKVTELVWIDRDVEALYWDARVLLDTIKALPQGSPEQVAYLRALHEAFQHIDWLNPPDAAFAESVRQARAMLQAGVYSQPLEKHTAVPRPIIHAVGHAHIDVAWLWPLSVTRGKAERTFATAVALMDQYPAYQFTQSTPVLYQMVAQDNPDLFSRIKEKIAAGQWNATGATWVEMDTNIPSGEALVRQFLFGLRYFERELGVKPEVLWLPDGFGFNAALPQLMLQAGIRYFSTNKLSWNSHTKMPYDTFWWEGLDGSQVLTHFLTTPETRWDEGIEKAYSTYVAVMTPEEALGTWTRYKQKAHNHYLITAFGIGDGGGGPNRDMLERRARLENLSGLPQVFHSTVEAFFHALEENMVGDLPRWVGELYFQLHRGTYTSQARIKQLNRKCEVLLHDAEALASLHYLLSQTYPHDEIDNAWETVLLNQFHDILPGTSIREVHEEAERDYTRVRDDVSNLIQRLLAALAQEISCEQKTAAYTIFNTIHTSLGGLVEVTLPGDDAIEIVDANGNSLPFQWLDQENGRALINPNAVPGYGYKVYFVRSASQTLPTPVQPFVSATPTQLENELLRAEFDAKGNLIRLYDIENGRDIIVTDKIGNQLWVYVDRPYLFDAWEVPEYLHDQGWQLQPESSRVVENGPVRAALEVTYRFNKSKIVQHISLAAGQRMLTFKTDVAWHERHMMLKTQFPLAIRAMNATYDVPFGTVQRPTHHNTPWDQAQFEVPAQQWADLSDGRYGVSLLNDCKYGYSAAGNTLMLSLLRASTDPDPEADQGHHQFTYAIYPHTGDWREGTICRAKRLNHPLHMYPLDGTGTRMPIEMGLVDCPTVGVVIDTVKKAEDTDGLIVRVYEGHGGYTPTTLTFIQPVQAVAELNILEEPVSPVELIENAISFNMNPYQIRSFKVTIGDLSPQE